MPTSARKSSVGGARRGIRKAHIPYRGDNPAVGKKTGIAVRHVERKSDGFEPFEELLQQADKRTPPPLVRARRKMKSTVIEEEEVDENGEMSMDLDNSPFPLYTSARQHETPTSSRRGISSSRIVAQTPEMSFDTVPSPRRRSLGRKSMGHAGQGRSRLSMRSTVRHSSPEADAIDDILHNGPDANGFDQHHYSPGLQSLQRTSFTQMDQDDDDDEGNEPFRDSDMPYVSDPPLVPAEVEEVEPLREPKDPPTKQRRGSERREERGEEDEQRDSGEEAAAIPQDDYDMEDDRHEDRHEDEDEVRHEPEKASRQKKGKSKSIQDEANMAPEGPRKRTKKENKPPRYGVRKSTREHFRPLEWWRGERYVYGREKGSGPVLVAPIKEIMRIPKEPPVPLGSKRKRSMRGRSKSRVIEQPAVVYNPEEGWDDNTADKCVILEYPGGAEKLRRVGFTDKMYEPQMAANNEWKYQRIFGDSEFIAAGQLTIPVAGRKPSKSAKDNTYIFYVAEGAVNFKVHDTSLILATGGMVMVPRGNTYYIENIADREAKLVFTQARKMAPSEEEIQYQQQVNNRQSTETGLQ